jgi:hypothetical protein
VDNTKISQSEDATSSLNQEEMLELSRLFPGRACFSSVGKSNLDIAERYNQPLCSPGVV